MPTFIPTNQPSSLASNRSSNKIGTSSGVSVEKYVSEYIRPVDRVYINETQAEKWFIMSEDMQNWIEIEPDQLWFWTNEWQAGEQEVDEERQQGLTKRFKNVDDLISFLDE